MELLPAIRETTEDYDEIERKIKALFEKEIYFPIMRELGLVRRTLTNAIDNKLLEALKSGRIQFVRGTFHGKLNAGISADLKSIGAKWDRATSKFRLPLSSLPYDVRAAILAGESRFQDKLDRIDAHLAQILPEEIAGKINFSDQFDRTLWKTEKGLKAGLKRITVEPQLSDWARKTIAHDWSESVKLNIKDFAFEEILKLRKDMQSSVFAGNRYETAIKQIQKSYGVTENKAKFIARQETGLLMAKFKQTRYQDVGLETFVWKCVHGTPAHPVRASHKILDGKIFSWNDPRELNKNGTVKAGGVRKPDPNKNPGEDYNCRCAARPIINFREALKPR